MMEATSLKLIRTCFESEHYPEYFKGHDTHESNVRFIGQIIARTQDRDLMKRIVASGLPEDYTGDALDEVDVIIDGALKKGFHKRDAGNKELKPKKSIASAILLSLVEAADVELFHDALERTYISIQQEGKGRKNYPLTHTSALRWLQKLYYDEQSTPIPSHFLKEAIETLQARARFDSPQKPVFLRVAKHENSVVINLADADGSVVVVDADGYRVTTEAPVVFINSAGMQALPVPEPGGNLQALQQLLGLDDINFCRIVAFLINCLRPEGPYIFLLIEGEQGSGKSLLCMLLKQLIDPHQASKLRLPGSERDLMIQAKDSHLLSFDNISGIKGEISDALCTLSTGGGFATRKLYTDDEQQIFNECRPFILNGISGVGNRPDLLERSVSLRLPTMAQDKRKTEETILKEFIKLKPYIFGCLCEAISCALRRSTEVQEPTSVRMADAAKWLTAAEPATGLMPGTLLRALETSQNEVILDRIANNSLAIALAKAAGNVGYEGTVGALFDRLEELRPKFDRTFPASPAYLSNALERMRPALAKLGIMVEIQKKKRYGRPVRIWLEKDSGSEEIYQTWIKSSENMEF